MGRGDAYPSYKSYEEVSDRREKRKGRQLEFSGYAPLGWRTAAETEPTAPVERSRTTTRSFSAFGFTSIVFG